MQRSHDVLLWTMRHSSTICIGTYDTCARAIRRWTNRWRGGIAGAYPPVRFRPVNRPTNTRRLILPTDHKRRLHEWKINHHDSKRQRTGHQTRTSAYVHRRLQQRPRQPDRGGRGGFGRRAQGGHRLSRRTCAAARLLHRTQAGFDHQSGAFRPLLDVRLPEHAALRTHASLES